MSKKSKQKKHGKRAGKTPYEVPGEPQVLPGPTGSFPDDRDFDLPAEVFGSGRLLETCRTYWQHGKWAALRALTEEQVAQDRDRGKLAALLAAEASHSGDLSRARQFMRLAHDWRCSTEILSRLMISAAQNTLGRAAMAAGEVETAATHFRDAIALVEPHADAETLARVRHIREAADMGLKQQAAQLFEAAVYETASLQSPARTPDTSAGYAALAEAAGFVPSVHPEAAPLPYPEPPQELREVKEFSAPAHRRLWESDAPILYVDSKSLPRSGLHFFRNTLARILGSDFSFCEKYNEPGCCQMSPCLVPFAAKNATFRLRLAKSHDFALADPAWATGGRMTRIVLIRDPLFVLTSWWSLQTLYKNSELLARNGIKTSKVNYQHETAVIDTAHRLVAEQGTYPSTTELAEFLAKNGNYIVGFVKKWTDPELLASGNASVRDYSETEQLVHDLLAPWEDRMSADTRLRFRRFALDRRESFTPRADAFAGPTPELTQHLQQNEEAFRKAAEEICDRVGPGIFRLAPR